MYEEGKSVIPGGKVIFRIVSALSVLAMFLPSVPASAAFYLHGSGPNANPAVLFLDNTAPTATTEKYRDSAGVNFSGGNPWREIGTWTIPATGALTALSDLHVWLGLKNSDDVGTRFDLRAEIFRNGQSLIASSETYCIQGITRNATLAKEVIGAFGSFSPVDFSGADTLSLKVLTRVGTDGAGVFCGGHGNAVGLRLYFDAVSRPSRFAATLSGNLPPVAEAGLDQNVLAGDRVTLDGRNSYDPEGALITYVWSLLASPSGSLAALDNPSSVLPSFTPDFPGTYVSSLVVSDGQSNSLPDNVSVFAQQPNVPPTANAGPDQSVVTGTVVQLDGRGSFDPESAPLSWSWQMLSRPAGSNAVLDDSSAPLPTFLADVSGQYIIRLIVNDGQLDSSPDNVSVVAAAPNAAPVAFAGPDNTVSRNAVIHLDGTQSYDPDNDPLSFAWSIVSRPVGGTSALDNAASSIPSILADGEGDFVFRLVVNDGQIDSSPDTVVVTSVNDPPVADAGPDQNVPRTTTLTLDGSGSHDANGDALTYAWSILSAPSGSTVTIANPSAVNPLFTPDLAGTYVIRLMVSDGTAQGTDNVTITAAPLSVTVPDLFGKPQGNAQAILSSAGLVWGTVTTGYSGTVIPGNVMGQTPAAGASVPQGSSVNLVISSGPAPVVLPPNPATVAPPVDPTVATTVHSASAFLYTGPDPVQTGVAPGTIELRRAAVLRGIVTAMDDTPLSGVAVSILSHPEFGRTLTREDGRFDMAVNGGGLLTVDYKKGGYLPSQRQVSVPWQDYVVLPDVVMIPFDAQVTAIDLASTAPVQVARGSAASDSDGTRRATLLFLQGTQAVMTLPDGSTRPLTTMNVRATEYTVGPNGPKAMPGDLPPAVAYTYCVELSADEAVAAGAREVRFSRPVPFYLENFLNFPVGEIVPVGFYDNEKGAWIPSDNGRVIKIVSVTSGMVDLDTDGDGAANNAAALSALGIADAERAELAVRYPVGATLWRMPISHFSRPDANFPSMLGAGQNAAPPNLGDIATDHDLPNACLRIGSIIECENQTLGQSVEVAGTPFSLNYRSNRVEGRTRSFAVTIPLSKGTVPSGLLRIALEIEIAGRRFAGTFPAAPNQSYPFAWDGLDAYGRPLRGKQSLKVRVGHVFRGEYMSPPAAIQSFGRFGDASLANLTREEVTIWQTWVKDLGAWEAKTQGLGGFTLDIHHTYDPASRTLYVGDGTLRAADDMKKVLSTAAGSGEWAHYHADPYNGYGWFPPHVNGFSGDGGPATQAMLYSPKGVTVGADGSVFVADTGNSRIRRVGPDGTISTVAGNGLGGFSGDGGPATQARLSDPRRMALGPDGSLYINAANNARVRKVGPDGIITTVAGNGTYAYNGDDIPATQAGIYPYDIAIGPEGNLYIFDVGSGFFRIRRVGIDGIISTIASAGGWFGGLATGPDGSVYFGDGYVNQIKRIGTDGQITRVAGGGQLYGDGIPATQARINSPSALAVAPDGSLYMSHGGNDPRIRKVSPDGIITTVVGTGAAGVGGDGVVATQASAIWMESPVLGPDGAIYFADPYNNRIRRVGPPLPGMSMEEISVSSEDGGEIFVFRGDGKHLRTVNAITGANIYRFQYEIDGRLSGIVDGNNNVTTIERDSSGNPAAIVAPGGQRTALSPDPNGYLGTIADPGGNTRRFGYTDKGLMTSYADPDGNPHIFVYNAQGLLERDEDPDGGFLSLARTETATGFFVTAGTALGRSTRYEMRNLPTGAEQRIDTFPTGARGTLDIGVDGRRTSVLPDGTVTEIVSGPDPRFGMTTPLPSSYTVRTPGGLLSTATLSRAAPLSNPADPLSLLSQTDTTTVNGRTFTQAYTASQKMFTLTTPVGRISKATIDDQGRVLRFSAASSVDNVTFGYDSRGRLAQTGQGGKTWTFGYDARNRLTSVSDPLTQSVQYGYDESDRVSRAILPSGRTYQFGHDNNGNLTSITMPSGAVHGLGYTKINLDNSYAPPGNPAYGTQYNLDREWVRTSLPSGRAIDGGYGNGGRLRDVTYPEAAVSMTYFDNTDRVGTLTRASATDNQSIAFSYDGFLTTRVAYSGVANGEYRYSYDNNFWVTGIALDNVWTTLARDNDGLLTRYGPFTITRSGPAGAPSNLTDNVLNVSYTYDSFGRPWTRTHTVAGQQVYQLALAYDNVGRISTKTEVVAGTSHVLDYTYDLDGQLVEVRRDSALVEQYGYDNNANRTNTLGATATYDEQDRLIQQGGVSYTFDDDGYLTVRGSDTFSYSASGELLFATASGQTVAYHYDGMGRRIAKTDAVGTAQYLYGNPGNPFQVTASRDAAGVLTTYFYDTAGNLFSFDRGGQRYYVATDQLGTPKAVADVTGAVVKSVEYYAWGVKLSDTNPSFDLPIGFAGGIADTTTGLVRFGWRDYEPGTGRWMARDPVLFRGGQANLYQYVANSPVNLTDPSGQFDPIGAAVGGIVGGISGGLTASLGQNSTMGDIATAAVAGAVGGAIGGAFDLSMGGAAGLGAGLGAGLAAINGSNVGGIIGGALGGGIGGAMTVIAGGGPIGVGLGGLTGAGSQWFFEMAGNVLYDAWREKSPCPARR